MLEDRDLENISEIIDKKVNERLEYNLKNIVTKQDLINFAYKEEEKRYATKYDIEDFKQKFMLLIKDELNKFSIKIENLLHK